MIEAVSQSLLTVRVGMEGMCRQEGDLLDADAAFQFITDELKNQSHTNAYSAKLNDAIEKRFLERRTRYSKVYQHLENGSIASEFDPFDDYTTLSVGSRPEILSSLYTLLLPFEKQAEPVTNVMQNEPEVPFMMFASSQDSLEQDSQEVIHEDSPVATLKKRCDEKLQEYLDKARPSMSHL